MSLSVVFLLCVLLRLFARPAQAASDLNVKRSSFCWMHLSKLRYTENATNAEGPHFDGLEDFARAFYGAQVMTQQKIERGLGVTKTFLDLLNSPCDFDGDAEEVKRDFLKTADGLLPIVWPSCPAHSPLQLSIMRCVTQDVADMFDSSQDIDPEIEEKTSSTEDENLAQKQEPEVDEESLSFRENQTRAFEPDFESEAGSETDIHASSDDGTPTATSQFEVEGDNKDEEESASATENLSCTEKSATDDPTEHWKRASHSDLDARSEGRCSRRDTENAPTLESENEKSQTSEERSGSFDEFLRLLAESKAREDKSKTTAEKNEPEDFELFEDLIHGMKNPPDCNEVPDWESGTQESGINRHCQDLAGGIIPQVMKSHEGRMHCPAVDGSNFWQPGPHGSIRCPVQEEAARSTRKKLEERPVTGENEASGILDIHFSDEVSSLEKVSNRSDTIEIEAAKMNFGSNLEYFIFDNVFWKNDLSEEARKSAGQSSDQSENQEASEEQSIDLPGAPMMKTPTTDTDFFLENENWDTEAIKNPADVHQDQEEQLEYIDEEVRELHELSDTISPTKPDNDDPLQGCTISNPMWEYKDAPPLDEEEYKQGVPPPDDEEVQELQELSDTIRRIKQEVDRSDVTQALGGGKGKLQQHASRYDIPYEIRPTTKPSDNDDPLQGSTTPNPMWEYRQDAPPLEEYRQGVSQPDDEDEPHKVTTTLPPYAVAADCAMPDVHPPPEAPDRDEF